MTDKRLARLGTMCLLVAVAFAGGGCTRGGAASARLTVSGSTTLLPMHTMQQAARVSDFTAFFLQEQAGAAAHLIEFDRTEKLFTSPTDKRTEDYITGRFG